MTILVFGPCSARCSTWSCCEGWPEPGITAQIVATIGLTIALPAAGLFIVDEAKLKRPTSSPPRRASAGEPRHVWHLTDMVPFDTDQLAILSAAAFTALLLWILVRRTPLGLQMRACVDRRDLASLRGVDPGRSSLIASMLSTTLAGAGRRARCAVALAGSPNNYTEAMLVSAAAAVFARFTQHPAGVRFGLALGVSQNLIAGYVTPHVGVTGLSSAAPYILIFIGLLLLNATRGRRAGIGVGREDARDRHQPPAGVAPGVAVDRGDDRACGLDLRPTTSGSTSRSSGLCLAPVFVVVRGRDGYRRHGQPGAGGVRDRGRRLSARAIFTSVHSMAVHRRADLRRPSRARSGRSSRCPRCDSAACHWRCRPWRSPSSAT